MNRLLIAVAALIAVGLGLGLGYFWGAKQAKPSAGDTSSTTATTRPAERRVLYWYDPMVPDQHFEQPGKSPFMDMQLVPKYADDAVEGGVRIDAGLQQNVGIRTTPVERGILASTVRVPGTLTWDLREETVVTARAEGVVTRVQVKTPYAAVTQGQPLATLLVPAWSGALAEARALRQGQSRQARDLSDAAERRLRVLGVPRGGTNPDGSVTLRAPRDGVVAEVLAREGQTVMPGAPLFRINGTATLWLEAAVPQANVAALRPDTPIEAIVSAVPDQTFAGQVDALLPEVDMASRTQRARIVLRNPEGLLAPGMFAEVVLQPGNGSMLPLVPSEALIVTGTDSRVIVQRDDGRFVPMRVRTGRSAEGRTEVLAGLDGSERVVVSGQFLIDSEASLSGALNRLETMDDADASEPPPSPVSRAEPSPERACPVQYWYDPMVPDQHFDQPGKSPSMDMQLVPKFAPDAARDCTIHEVVDHSKGEQP